MVAGGISYWSFTENHPTLNLLKSNITEQAKILADAGADLLILEMMVDIDRMMVTLQASAETNLPIWVGLSCKLNENGRISLLNGEPLQKAIKSIERALKFYPSFKSGEMIPEIKRLIREESI